jgi:UDP-N-acetylmuramyl pentapeptide phosphotransferase/UDP-N-acetylglucosamine-1-phosphate transferase
MRNPLDKEKFLGGNRQKWMGVLLFYSILMATLQIKYQIDPSPYIQYAMTLGSLFILGGSVDSYLKINAANKQSQNTSAQ